MNYYAIVFLRGESEKLIKFYSRHRLIMIALTSLSSLATCHDSVHLDDETAPQHQIEDERMEERERGGMSHAVLFLFNDCLMKL